MTDRELQIEYENIILGKKRNYSSAIFGSPNKEINQKNAICIMKYAFESFLNWSPEDVKRLINPKIIRLMKLENVIKYIQFPGELNPKTDLFYIAHLMYPNIIHYNSREITLKVYKDILNKKIYRFPKDFFEDDEGVNRARLCFRYMVQNYFHFHNLEEMYEYFASSKGKKALKEYQLLSVCDVLYSHPLDYMHDSLIEEQQDEFLYNYLKFEIEYGKAELKYEENEKNQDDL